MTGKMKERLKKKKNPREHIARRNNIKMPEVYEEENASRKSRSQSPSKQGEQSKKEIATKLNRVFVISTHTGV